MTHPLHQPCKIAEWNYVFGLTLVANDEYYEVHLPETEESREFTKRYIWETNRDKLYVQISENDKYLIVSFPDGINRTILISQTKPPEKTKPDKISRIKEMVAEKKKVAEFKAFLKKLGLKFDIDFCRYKEDSDYMTVTYRGKEIFSGRTEHLD